MWVTILASTIATLLALGGFQPFPQQEQFGALSVLKASQGGTGIGAAAPTDIGKVVKVTNDNPFTYELATDNAAGGGGSGTVSTSTAETKGTLAYWTSNSATPALLGKVSTTTASCSGDTSCTSFTVIGASPVTISSSGGSGFSTTSADYWKTVRDFFSTTSADYWETQQTARTADDLTNNQIDDLSDVAALSETLGDILTWNGSAWVDAATSTLNLESPLTFSSPLSRTGNAVSFLFNTFNTWTAHNIFSSLFATNSSSTNATTTHLTIPSLTSKLLRTDANGKVADVTIGTNLSFDGTTLSATGGGGSGGGTWSTTTSSVAGTLVNYPNNTSDVVAIGSNSTTTAEFYVDPNTLTAQFGNGAAQDSILAFGSSTLWSTGLASTTLSYYISPNANLTSNPALIIDRNNLLTFGSASSTLFTANYASSTLYYGAGLATCQSGNMLTWAGGQFGCEPDDTGGGGGSGNSKWATSTDFAIYPSGTNNPSVIVGRSTQYAQDFLLGLFATTTTHASPLIFASSTPSATGSFISYNTGDPNNPQFSVGHDGGVSSEADGYFATGLESAGALFNLSNAAAQFTFGLAGIIFTQDGDGALTIASNGDGSQESLTLNLDDTADTAVWTSSTGVSNIDWSAIALSTFAKASTTQISASERIYAAAGSVSAPSITFSGDTDTGIWGNGGLNGTVNGTQVFGATAAAFSPTVGTYSNFTDSATDVAFGWLGDGDTGLFSDVANTVSVAAGSIVPAVFRSSGASTTNITNSGYASTTSFYGAGLTLCNSGNVLTYDGAGKFGCAADQTGTGGSYPFTTLTNFSQTVSATTTPLWAQNGLYASSTLIADNATTTNATTTSLAITGVTSALLSTNAAGKVIATSTLNSSFLSSIDRTFYFSTTSANFWAATGAAFSTTSTDFWKTARDFFSTTSVTYWESQFGDWNVVSGSLRPTTTIGVLVNASSTILNLTSVTSTSTSATSSNFFAALASTTNLFAQTVTLSTTTAGTLKVSSSGRVWSDTSAAGGGYATIQDEGGNLTTRTILNFTGSGVSCADDGSDSTDCTINAGAASAAGSTGSIQFNNGGSLDGIASFIYDKTNNEFGIGTTSPWAKLSITASSSQPVLAISSSSPTQTNIYDIFTINHQGYATIGSQYCYEAAGVFCDIENIVSTTTRFQISTSTTAALSNLFTVTASTTNQAFASSTHQHVFNFGVASSTQWTAGDLNNAYFKGSWYWEDPWYDEDFIGFNNGIAADQTTNYWVKGLFFDEDVDCTSAFPAEIGHYVGTMRLTTGATAASGCHVDMGNTNQFQASSTPAMEIRLRPTSVVTTMSMMVGFANVAQNATAATSTTGQQGAYFFYNPSVSGNWQAVTRSSLLNGATTTTTVAPAQNTDQILRIQMSSTTASFFINGVLVAKHSDSTLPPRNFEPELFFETWAASARVFEIDYIKVWADRRR